MPLKALQHAPSFVLRDTGGKEWSFPREGYSLLIFYKVTCPTCQLTLPFVEKMYRAYGSAIGFFGIAQDPSEEVSRFAVRHGLSFTQLIDPSPYDVSFSYDVQVVPTLYLTEGDRILRVEESFFRNGLEALNAELARLVDAEPIPLFEGVSVPPFKPG
jgi:peroxiredoxin